jgi:FADH2 O2-dependent halogenase
MKPGQQNAYDIVIAGAGFAGSLAALALSNCGFKVCLMERGKHPRFAIGESSTPIADMILRELSVKYNLPWLYDFSRYGSWQKTHPEIVCGIKRGFSYYKHYPGKEFSTGAGHANELLVAASTNDAMSDTNWLREDFDAFLVSKLEEYNIGYLDLTEIISATRENSEWKVTINCAGNPGVIQSSFFIDATGSGVLADKLFSVKSSAAGFLTRSFAVFSHFDHFPRWTDILRERGVPQDDYPYDPDHSALHHVLDEGWAWALRFNNDRTSWGFVLDGGNHALQKMTAEEIWNALRAKYPDMDRILRNASFASRPGSLLQTPRLQRRLDKCFGDGWVAMPHTAGFVDPLFSTGIAYSLAGLEKILHILSTNRNFGPSLYEQLREYERAVFEELRLIDLLVYGCYRTMARFPLFNAWSMLYFTFTILQEQRRLQKPAAGQATQSTECFLEADNPEVKAIAQATYKELLEITHRKRISSRDADRFTDAVRRRIQPFNTAGLLDPATGNMYRHSAVEL